MKSLPHSIYKVVQGLSYPRNSEILVLGNWETKDWSCTQTVVTELSTSTEIVILSMKGGDHNHIIERYRHIDYKFHIVVHGHSEEEIQTCFQELNPKIIKSRESYIGIIVHSFGEKSFLADKIRSDSRIDIDDQDFFLPNFKRENWTQEQNRVTLKSAVMDIDFYVPGNFSIKHTSSDLLWAIEHVLFSPWDDKYNLPWVPTRRPGNLPGLSFSGGVDSTAAMCLMPSNSLLFYLERNFESMIQHENAKRFLSALDSEGRKTVSIQSNHEKIRTFYGKNPGFSTDYACMAHLILVADFYDLDAAATGMPLENTYFFHGSKVRDFAKSNFWKRYAPMFSYLGIPIYQPVAGCSEIVNNTIVKEYNYSILATSCLRSKVAGETCNSCWKCFRKNTFNGQNWSMSPEISKFLAKRPLKQGIATLYALQLMHKKGLKIPKECEDLIPLMEKNLEFLNNYWEPSLELLPTKYRKNTEEKLSKSIQKLKLDLYAVDDEITDLLRGVAS
jgi:hypothetical protein